MIGLQQNKVEQNRGDISWGKLYCSICCCHATSCQTEISISRDDMESVSALQAICHGLSQSPL